MDATRSAVEDREPHFALRPGRDRIRFGVVCAFGMALLYGLIYYPYPPDSTPERLLVAYASLQADLTAELLRLLGETIDVTGNMIAGRFAMQIILDCAALDVQALFLVAVLAFPVALSARIKAALLGLLAIQALNIGRLALLYYVGVYWSEWFGFVHEELMQLVMIAATCAAFALFASSATARERRAAQALPPAAALGGES